MEIQVGSQFNKFGRKKLHRLNTYEFILTCALLYKLEHVEIQACDVRGIVDVSMEDNQFQNPYMPPIDCPENSSEKISYWWQACWFNLFAAVLCVYHVINLDFDFFGYEFLNRPGFWIYLIVGVAIANLFFWILFMFQESVVRPLGYSNWFGLLVLLSILFLGWAITPRFVEIGAKYFM